MDHPNVENQSKQIFQLLLNKPGLLEKVDKWAPLLKQVAEFINYRDQLYPAIQSVGEIFGCAWAYMEQVGEDVAGEDAAEECEYLSKHELFELFKGGSMKLKKYFDQFVAWECRGFSFENDAQALILKAVFEENEDAAKGLLKKQYEHLDDILKSVGTEDLCEAIYWAEQSERDDIQKDIALVKKHFPGAFGKRRAKTLFQARARVFSESKSEANKNTTKKSTNAEPSGAKKLREASSNSKKTVKKQEKKARHTNKK